MSHLIGKFVWFELITKDVERAKGFYGELFGWGTAEMPMGDRAYTLFKNGEAMVGGAMARPDGAPRWASYVSVADVDASLKAALAHGATKLSDAMDVPNVGRMAELRDPTGAPFHLFHATDGDPAERTNVVGDFHWNELWSSDPVKAAKFYGDVLGYTTSEMEMGEMGTYRVLSVGETSRAGIMKQPPQALAGWVPYVTVAKADDAVARAARLGGQVINGATDVPGVGRFAVLADPQGALIAVITPESMK